MSAFGYMPASGRVRDYSRHLIGAPNLLRRLQVPALLELLDARAGDRLLEIGCGPGWMAVELGRAGLEVVALDQCRFVEWPMWGEPGVSWVMAEGERLPFGAQQFDRILLSSVLQMVPRPDLLLGECFRVLRDRGRLVLSVPGPYPWLFRSHSPEQLRKELQVLFSTSGRVWMEREELAELLTGAGFDAQTWKVSPGPVSAWAWQVALAHALRVGREPSLKRLFFLLYPLLACESRVSQLQGRRENRGGEWLVSGCRAPIPEPLSGDGP